MVAPCFLETRKSHVFFFGFGEKQSQTLGAMFARIFMDCARICNIQTFWGCACTPTSYTTGAKHIVWLEAN